MRTNLDTQTIKNIIDTIFNGNLRKSRASKGSITYENPNSEQITLKDPIDGSRRNGDLAEYLNIHFYNWKERLEELDKLEDKPQNYEEWVNSLDWSMNQAYALVEKIDEEATPSQDIDNATIIGKITFMIQTNKIDNLDYYVAKLRNKYLGVPEDIQNSYGDKIKAYISIGSLIYEQEPTMTQLGEVVQVVSNFRISYLTNAQTWTDTKIEISLEGDIESKYLEMPITKASFQDIFTSNAVPTIMHPDQTGFIASSLSSAKTFTFFDFNKPLTEKFNELFWSCSAYKIDGVMTTTRDVNIPVFIRITNNGKTYTYKDMIDNMQKSMTNSDFNICSITTKTWGKIAPVLEGE